MEAENNPLPHPPSLQSLQKLQVTERPGHAYLCDSIKKKPDPIKLSHALPSHL